MSLQFEDGQNMASQTRQDLGNRDSSFSRAIMKLGWAKTPAQANGMLIILSVIGIILAIGILMISRYQESQSSYQMPQDPAVFSNLPTDVQQNIRNSQKK